MASNRKNLPPYEIMRSRSRKADDAGGGGLRSTRKKRGKAARSLEQATQRLSPSASIGPDVEHDLAGDATSMAPAPEPATDGNHRRAERRGAGDPEMVDDVYIGRRDAWRRWRTPIVFRLPRGYVAIAAMGFLAMLLISYMAGEQRGYKRGRTAASNQTLPPELLHRDARTQLNPLSPRIPSHSARPGHPGPGSTSQVGDRKAGQRNASGASGGYDGSPTRGGSGDAQGGSAGGANLYRDPQAIGEVALEVLKAGGTAADDGQKPAGQANSTGQAGPTGADAGTQVKPSVADPRRDGHWYFVLVHANQAYAERVIRYLAEQGVEATGIQGHNKGLFRVLALPGFTTEEKRERTPPFLAFERQLRLLGRQWRANHKAARAWEDLYPSQYQGGEIKTLIRLKPAD